LILFLFFLVFTTTLAGVLSYYVNLLFFDKKEVYEREEITQVLEPVIQIVGGVFESGGNLILGIGLFVGSALLVWLLGLLGGAVGTPHYTNSFGNYFFNAPILYLAFLFGFPFLKEGFSSPGPTQLFFAHGRAVVSGLGLGSLSTNLATWGMYHEFYFLFVFLIGILVLYPLCFVWNGKSFFGISIGPKPKVTPDWDEDIYAEPESYSPPPNKTKTTVVSNENPFTEDPSDWDEIEEGGLGDDVPSLDDFEDPK